ncbi:MAG: class I SAM-dependent methyltransferase family protein [Hyphomicrobiaceae bacterium]
MPALSIADARALARYEQLKRPLPAWHPKTAYYGAIRMALTMIGPLSEGIGLGLRHGFDSGLMLDYVYRNEARGTGPLGRAIDRVYLNSPGWKGIRARGTLVTRAISEEIDGQLEAGLMPAVADLACGGGRYALSALAGFRGKPIEARLSDYEPANVRAAAALARELGVHARFEQADAFATADLDRIGFAPTLVVVSGLHEIVPDDARLRQHLKDLAVRMARPATLLLTVQPHHPQHELIARCLNAHSGGRWVMRLRPLETTLAWLEDAGFVPDGVTMEDSQIFGVVRARLR